MHWKKHYKFLAVVLSLAVVAPMTVTATGGANVIEATAGELTDRVEGSVDADVPVEPNTEAPEPEVPQTEPETQEETKEPETKEEESSDETDETEKPEESEKPGKETDETEEDPKETEKESESESESESETEEETDDKEDKEEKSNEKLVANQNIVIPPEIPESFRFVTVEKDYAIVTAEELLVYEDQDEEADVVGKLAEGALCYILNDKEEDWVYIESDLVRGFVKAEGLLMDEEAEEVVEEEEEEKLKLAETVKDPLENEARLYTKTTVYETVVDKVYAINTADKLNVREDKNTKSRIVGTLPQNALCYVLADEEEEWIYVESDDVRGFVHSEYLLTGEEAEEQVEEKGEDKFKLANEIIKPEENEACYYTFTSIKEGISQSEIRNSIVKYALQFVGNPYVWGGTSLTNGADCSGYVQSIYKAYGYSLPRVAEDQAKYGMQIPVSEAAPGDLIFYAKSGYVYHVVMYIGEGKVVHASSSRTGIKVSGIDSAHAVWATRVLKDE